jgi:hypothetical protein
MSVVETSIEAFHAIKSDGTLTNRQKQVMAVIRLGRDYSLQELVMLTGLPVNVISGRVNELKGEVGLLEHGPTRKCTLTNRTIHPVRLRPAQGELFTS